MKLNKSSRLFTFIARLLMGTGLCLILFSTVPYLKEFIHYKNQEIFYNTLITNTYPVKIPSSSFSSLIINSCHIIDFTPTAPQEPIIQEKFIPLLEINPEVIGWITINDTPINYPIMQHSDNQYYLNYDSSNSPSIYGSIYIDHRNNSNLDNKNTLIYGHNMNNGSMFHALVNYKEQGFFEKHPYIYVSNLYETFTYEVFAVYVVDADKETIGVHYENDIAFLDYITSCKARSIFTKNMDFTATDQIITLVTCSYELDNARTIVQAKRINEKINKNFSHRCI